MVGEWVTRRATLVMKTNKCKTCSKAAKNSREVMRTPDGWEQTNAKDLEKLSKIDSEWGDGSQEQQTSTTLKVFWLGETKGIRTLTNVACISLIPISCRECGLLGHWRFKIHNKTLPTACGAFGRQNHQLSHSMTLCSVVTFFFPTHPKVYWSLYWVTICQLSAQQSPRIAHNVFLNGY